MNNDALLKFLESYGGVEPPQDPIEAATDSQLKSVTTILAHQLAGTPGYIIDVGAGRGTLLARLASLESFPGSTWEYVAVEDPRHHLDILGLAVKFGVHKQVSPIALEKFYLLWPRSSVDCPQIVFVRNVFHELDIPDAAKLLAHFHEHISIGSLLIVQDLAVFPIAEKGNVCWDRKLFCSVLETLGFNCASVDEPTKSGNLWFNIVATRTQLTSLTVDDVRLLVVNARIEQWREWARAGALSPAHVARDSRIAKIDFDLQFAALTLQLQRVAAKGIIELSSKQEEVVAIEIFERCLSRVELRYVHDNTDVAPVRHFKDRRDSKDALQAFLAGSRPVAAITGPAMMGKTVLVQHVLSSFAHRRKLIQLDALASWTTWNIIELIFSACDVRVPPHIVGHLQLVEFKAMHGILREFAEQVAPRAVLVIDHFERLFGPRERPETEISDFLSMWAQIGNAKIIITSRRAISVGVLNGVDTEINHPPVGRFPRGPHVTNLLSTFVPIHKFPEAFVEAIDRHPYMAELAGRILEQEGVEAVRDPDLQKQLREKLRSKLMERLCTDDSRPALMALMHARTALPRPVVEDVGGPASVREALETGLAYEVARVTGAPLVSCIQGFRLARAEDEDEQPLLSAGLTIHRKWASSLLDYYKNFDDDPRWLREAYYHTAVTADRSMLAAFGRQFRSELQDAGEYWFRHGKDFENALWAFNRVAELAQEPDPVVLMRIAACLLRTGHAERGLALFRQIFEGYPNWTGAKTSCVDGLLYLQRFGEALTLLREFADYSLLTNAEDSWVLGQYGRSFFGLERYEKAYAAFQKQLSLDDAAVVYGALARSLHRLGRRELEGSFLQKGHNRHRGSVTLIAALASWLEANGRPGEAVALIEPAIKERPGNAWLALPFVRALIATHRTEDARLYLAEHGSNLHPDFMRLAVEAQVMKAEGQFERALEALDSSSEDRSDNQHRVGQRAEVYVAWAASCGPPMNAQIARKALSEIPKGRNLLLNVSVLKLCILAGDRDRFKSTLQACQSVNPQSADVFRQEADARSIRHW